MINVIGIYLLLRGVAALVKPYVKNAIENSYSDDFLSLVAFTHALITFVFGLWIMWKL